MFTLNGKHNTATVFTDNIEEEAISQIIGMLNEPFSESSTIRIMPDVHAGAGCTIGTTMTIKDKVVPNLVGVDIGCGMLTIKLKNKEIDFESFDRILHENIPLGFDTRTDVHELVYKHPLSENGKFLDKMICKDHVNTEYAMLSLGTLGGGNHFVEIDKDDNGNLYLVIHTGSRHLGMEVAGFYQKLAVKDREAELIDIPGLIAEYKAAGRHKEINDAIIAAKANRPVINKDLAYLTGSHFDDYIHDMHIAQNFAKVNRSIIADILLYKAGLEEDMRFETIHNYIDMDNMILRKGSISAQNEELCLIPLNMRDGSLICRGKGNPEWNYSAPHGAGRLMSRSKAKENISLEDFQESMTGIFSTSVNESTLDESPMAYKPADEIIEAVSDTVKILDHIIPIYNCKA